jgi:hypothetical protein
MSRAEQIAAILIKTQGRKVLRVSKVSLKLFNLLQQAGITVIIKGV